MKNELKLYVWHDYACDYTCGKSFALAHNVDEARQLLYDETHGVDYEIEEREPCVYSAPIAFHVNGGS